MLDLLFKQLGVNPQQIKQQIDEAASNFTKVVNHFDERLNKVESKLDEIIRHIQEGRKD